MVTKQKPNEEIEVFNDIYEDRIINDQLPLWRQVGTTINGKINSIDEALTAANLNKKLSLFPVYVDIGDESDIPLDIPGYKAIVNEEKKTVLGLVTNSNGNGQNKLLQLGKKFSWLDNSLRAGLVKVQQIGEIDRGKKVFILLQLKGEHEVVENDFVYPHVCLTSSYDASTIIGYPLLIRASSEFVMNVSTRHLKNDYFRLRANGNPEETQKDFLTILDALDKDFSETADILKRASNKEITPRKAKELNVQLYDIFIKDKPSGRVKNKMARTFVMFHTCMLKGGELLERKLSLYRWYVAATEVWNSPESTSKTASAIAQSLFYGHSRFVMNRGFNLMQQNLR